MEVLLSNRGTTAMTDADHEYVICCLNESNAEYMIHIPQYENNPDNDSLKRFVYNQDDPICEFSGITKIPKSKREWNALSEFFQKYGCLLYQTKGSSCRFSKFQRYSIQFLLGLAAKTRHLIELMTYRNSGFDHISLLSTLIGLLSLHPSAFKYFISDLSDFERGKDPFEENNLNWTDVSIKLADYGTIPRILNLQNNFFRKSNTSFKMPIGEDAFEGTLKRLQLALTRPNYFDLIDKVEEDEIKLYDDYYQEKIESSHKISLGITKFEILEVLVRIHKEISPFYINNAGQVEFKKENRIIEITINEKPQLFDDILALVDKVISWELKHVVRTNMSNFAANGGKLSFSGGDLFHNMYIALALTNFKKYGYYKCVSKHCNNYVLRTHDEERRIRQKQKEIEILEKSVGKEKARGQKRIRATAYCCSKCRDRNVHRKQVTI